MTNDGQGPEKLNIYQVNTTSVIPEVAKRLSGIQKKRYLTGCRMLPALIGLVRYDDCGCLSGFSVSC